MTPTLSVDALHARLICDVETGVAVSPAGVEGGVVSPVGGGVVEPVSLNEIMPAAFATTAPEPVPSEILTVAVPALVVIETRYEVFAFNFAM